MQEKSEREEGDVGEEERDVKSVSQQNIFSFYLFRVTSKSDGGKAAWLREEQRTGEPHHPVRFFQHPEPYLNRKETS